MLRRKRLSQGWLPSSLFRHNSLGHCAEDACTSSLILVRGPRNRPLKEEKEEVGRSCSGTCFQLSVLAQTRATARSATAFLPAMLAHTGATARSAQAFLPCVLAITRATARSALVVLPSVRALRRGAIKTYCTLRAERLNGQFSDCIMRTASVASSTEVPFSIA